MKLARFGFVIDGLSLGFALEADLQDKLLAIALSCRSVVSIKKKKEKEKVEKENQFDKLQDMLSCLAPPKSPSGGDGESERQESDTGNRRRSQ